MSHSQHWQQHIDAWQQSGGSQAEYCRQHALDQSQFSYWKRKLIKTSEPQSVKSSRFAVAKVAVMPQPSSLTLTLPNGIVLGGIDAMNAAIAAKLLEYLR